jgi:hypothetical protein
MSNAIHPHYVSLDGYVEGTDGLSFAEWSSQQGPHKETV